MAYGQTDAMLEESKARQEAVNLLLEVAVGTKTQGDVRVWLEKEYPELCKHTEQKPKW